MALITLGDAKSYLRVDSADEDAMTGILLSSAEKLCADVARLTDRQWAAVNSDDTESEDYTKEALAHIREIIKVAILYAVGYMFEHREKADYTELTLTLR
ncbi:MAG: phage gp6-like head-tail connector protein, partial [Oscillospiraceae bacterium]|nr:phage gp6-like head-tail connector protein [Oscillospiraceae bacterium]